MNNLYKMEECKIKGSSIKAVVRQMQLKWGTAYLDSLNLPFDYKEIKKEKYYPYEWMRHLHKKIAEKSQEREEQIFKKIGYDIIKSSIQGHFVLNYVVRSISIEKLLSNMEKTGEYINVLNRSVKKEDEKILIIADQVCEDRSEQLCWIIEGGLNALMNSAKKNVTVKHVECQFHGGEHCIFEIVEKK